MEMRNPARAEMLANFTPVLCFNAFFRQDDAADADHEADEAMADAGIDRHDQSIRSLRSLVERMWLHPAEADMHRPTYDSLMTRALTTCRSAAVKDTLLDALRRVHGKDYMKALACLRAVAA